MFVIELYPNYSKFGFKGILYSPEYKQNIPTEKSYAQLERVPNEKHSFGTVQRAYIERQATLPTDMTLLYAS